MPRIRKPGSQAGFTLIEAMTAGVVLSILTLGLMGVWSSAGASVNSIVTREKAIWTLNAQMERLVALYQFTEFGATGPEATSGYGYSASYADDRMIFGPNTDASMAPPGTLPVVKLIVGAANGFLKTTATAFETEEGHNVFYDTGLLSAHRNYVWIDRDRDLIGRLSWEETDIVVDSCDSDNQPDSGADPCLCWNFNATSSGTRCREIALALEYPLRWRRSDNAIVDFSEAKEILTLRTIVGRRL